METILQFNTWQGLFSLALLLFVLYWLLKAITYALQQFARRNLSTRKTITILQKGLLIFKPIALILLLLDFISINYITHTILLAVIGVFGYNHIKNYLNGIFVKINPLVTKGAIIQISDFSGEVKQLLPLGLILNTENGERFISYSTVEVNGFAIKSNDSSLTRQTLYLHTDQSPDAILDLLFDNPILNYEESPVVKRSDEGILKLQYTLETGASSDALHTFFGAQKITTSLTNNQIS